MPDAADFCCRGEGKEFAVALVIAILALLLALAEAGAKNAQHLSTEKNIEFLRICSISTKPSAFARRLRRPPPRRSKHKKAR